MTPESGAPSAAKGYGMTDLVPTLSEVRVHLALLSNSLPTAVDPLSMIGGEGGAITRSKTPTVALCYREAQAWRMEEFMRAACDLLDRNDLVASIANTRHAAECCAGVWYLLEQIERAIKEVSDPADLFDQMMRLFVGTKIEEENRPKAINVLTFMQKLDRKIPGFFGSYERNLNLRCMMGSLEVFSYAYNRITDLIPGFCQACEQGIIRREAQGPPA